jgi:hypothetical protein
MGCVLKWKAVGTSSAATSSTVASGTSRSHWLAHHPRPASVTHSRHGGTRTMYIPPSAALYACVGVRAFVYVGAGVCLFVCARQFILPLCVCVFVCVSRPAWLTVSTYAARDAWTGHGRVRSAHTLPSCPSSTRCVSAGTKEYRSAAPSAAATWTCASGSPSRRRKSGCRSFPAAAGPIMAATAASELASGRRTTA